MAMMHVHRPMLTLSKKVAENREETKFRDRLALWSLFRPPPHSKIGADAAHDMPKTLEVGVGVGLGSSVPIVRCRDEYRHCFLKSSIIDSQTNFKSDHKTDQAKRSHLVEQLP